MRLSHGVPEGVVRDRQARDKHHAMTVLRPHQAARIDRDRILGRGLGWKQLTLGRLGHPPTVLPPAKTGQVWVRTPRTVAGYVLVEDATVMSGGLESDVATGDRIPSGCGWLLGRAGSRSR